MALKASAPFHCAVAKSGKGKTGRMNLQGGRFTENGQGWEGVWFCADMDGRGDCAFWDVFVGMHDRGTCFASIALHHFVHVVGAGNNGVILEW